MSNPDLTPDQLFGSPDFAPSLPPPTPASVYEPQKLNERHREVLRMKAAGATNRDIALALGISEVSVGYITRSEIGSEELNALSEAADVQAVEAIKIIKDAAPKAAQYLVDVATGTIPAANVAQRMNASGQILDRAGLPKVTRVEGSMFHEHVAHGLESLKARAREMGLLRDPEPIETSAEVLT